MTLQFALYNFHFAFGAKQVGFLLKLPRFWGIKKKSWVLNNTQLLK